MFQLVQPDKVKLGTDSPIQRLGSEAASRSTEVVSDLDLITRGLTSSSTLSEETGHPGKDIRPCIAALSDTQLAKGDFPNRNEAALILSSEYYRIGLDYDAAFLRVSSWNQYNQPPLKPSELHKALRNGYTGKYNYSCRHHALAAFCVGECCPFALNVKSKRKRVNNWVFIDYKWPECLSNRQVLIYFIALPHLEIRRRVGPGGLICANHGQIAAACGINVKRIGADLEVLRRAKLIEYEPGQPMKWKGKASEIRRIIPIPRPTRTVLRLLRSKVEGCIYKGLDTVFM